MIILTELARYRRLQERFYIQNSGNVPAFIRFNFL